jgi:hypothetical protein
MTALIALGAAALAIVAVVILAVRVSRLQQRLAVLPEDGGIFEALRRLDADLAANEEAVAALRPVVQSLHERLPSAICRTGVVAFDASGDLAGGLSRSIALMDERGNGLVLTALALRSEHIFYVKMLRVGRGMEPLSPEEAQAVARAMAG